MCISLECERNPKTIRQKHRTLRRKKRSGNKIEKHEKELHRINW